MTSTQRSRAGLRVCRPTGSGWGYCDYTKMPMPVLASVTSLSELTRLSGNPPGGFKFLFCDEPDERVHPCTCSEISQTSRETPVPVGEAPKRAGRALYPLGKAPKRVGKALYLLGKAPKRVGKALYL